MKRKRAALSGLYRAYYGSYRDHRRALAQVVSYCNAWVSPDVFLRNGPRILNACNTMRQEIDAREVTQ